MAQRTIRDLIDLALGGTLDQRLREHGKPGPSYDSLAAELAAKGVNVSGESLRRWAKRLEREESDEQVPA